MDLLVLARLQAEIFEYDYFFFRVRKYFPIAMMAKKAKAIMT